MTKTFFTADLHIGHRNIIKYCNRPFENERDMDTELIRRWNMLVGHDDEVYVVGDVSMGNPERTAEILHGMKGSKYLIAGNHDKKNRRNATFARQFVWVKDLEMIKLDGQRIVLCHYPMDSWEGSHHGSIHLHGHSHNPKPINGNDRRIDVGVDAWSYAPVTLDEIRSVIPS